MSGAQPQKDGGNAVRARRFTRYFYEGRNFLDAWLISGYLPNDRALARKVWTNFTFYVMGPDYYD